MDNESFAEFLRSNKIYFKKPNDMYVYETSTFGIAYCVDGKYASAAIKINRGEYFEFKVHKVSPDKFKITEPTKGIYVIEPK